MTTIITNKINIPEELVWTNHQPDKLDYLRPNGFRFHVQSLPNVTYFCQSASIPTVTLGYAIQQTPILDIPYPGEKNTYSELTVKFMVQESMQNYIELYEWMVNLGGTGVTTRGKAQSFRTPAASPNVIRSDGSPVPRKTDMTDYSDATLLVLGSNESPVARITFMDCFPISLSSLDFDVSAGSTQYFAAIATFKYRSFEMESLASSTTATPVEEET